MCNIIVFLISNQCFGLQKRMHTILSYMHAYSTLLYACIQYFVICMYTVLCYMHVFSTLLYACIQYFVICMYTVLCYIHVYRTLLYVLFKLLKHKVITVILVSNIEQWLVIHVICFKLHFKNHYLAVLILSRKLNE